VIYGCKFRYLSLATSSLLPYLTIHMQSIGITVEEIAIIYLALPFTTFLAPPITGILLKHQFGLEEKEIKFKCAFSGSFIFTYKFINANEWEQLRFATQDDQITSI
jgi:hypothetical protein